MGHDNFLRAIDHKIKTGDQIEWDEPEGDGRREPEMDQPEFETQLDTYVKLELPKDIDAAVWRHMDQIALATTGRHLRTKIEDAFKVYRELYQMRVKAHDNAIMHGFPTYTQRWFERPIYRYQQTLIGLGPVFCIGSQRPGEMTSIGMFNQAWINDNLSEDGRQAAEQYLELWNGWCRANLQGRPIAPIGVSAAGFAEENRHLMFVNDSGLVPTHLPWIIKCAVEWMEKHPCASNLVPRVEKDVVDHYGRHRRYQVAREDEEFERHGHHIHSEEEKRPLQLSVGTSEAHKTLTLFAALLSRNFDCDSIFRLIPKGGVETIPARSSFTCMQEAKPARTARWTLAQGKRMRSACVISRKRR
eukprot:3607268-Amphidinium_carterae.1